MEITQYYPFLRALTTEVRNIIDWDELYIPNSYEALLVTELSELLDMNIVVYKKGYQSKVKVPLCSVLNSATLNEAQQRALKKFEEKFGGFCILVAYTRPVQLAADFSIQNKKPLPVYSSLNKI